MNTCPVAFSTARFLREQDENDAFQQAVQDKVHEIIDTELQELTSVVEDLLADDPNFFYHAAQFFVMRLRWKDYAPKWKEELDVCEKVIKTTLTEKVEQQFKDAA